MNVSFEKNGNISGVLTIQIEKSDYADKVQKSLKTLRKQAQVPGFRPGHAPAQFVNKRFGAQVKMEEINKLVSDNLFGYIRENKLNMLGEPLSAEDQEPQEIETQDDFTFKFDIALKPEFTVELSKNDTIVYNTVKVSDEQIEKRINALALQAGHPESFEEYQERDIVRGKLVELEGSEPKTDGIIIDRASLMPSYFVDKEQEKVFVDTKKGDIVTFNLSKAYEGRDAEIATILKIEKEEVANHIGDFTFTIEDISRVVPAEMNQEFFDRIFGEGVVTDEEGFKTRVQEQMEAEYKTASDVLFMKAVREYTLKKIGHIEYSDTLLKRIMLQNNEGKSAEFIEENYEKSIEALSWQLVKEELAIKNEVRIEESDIFAAAINFAQIQFAQYGMNNIPQEYLTRYAESLLKDENQANRIAEQALEIKLVNVVKEVVTLDTKTLSEEEFEKLEA